jgi:para-nitrobenzyl esterase
MNGSWLAALLAGLALLAVVEASAEPSLTPPVQVEGGVIVGTRDGGLSSYKGVPFAAPPVLDLRWRPPAAVVPWSGLRIVDRFSAMCPQPLQAKHSVFYLGEEPSSEDCLYLNVWSTATTGERRPVMVFVYGGGWTIGSGSLPLYAGDGLARKGAVVVTFNYRVGALGFLAHPELTAEAGGAGSGN